MVRSRCVLTLSLLVAGAAAAIPSAGHAQDDLAAFYKGKNVDLVIGASPGGGHDIYARTIGRHIGRYIPGNPNLVARNMPGASSRRAAEFLYARAPKDGTAFGAIFPGAIMTPLTEGKEKTRLDPTRFNYVGTANKEVRVCAAWATAPVKTFADAMKTELIVGATADGGSTQDYALVLSELTGAKLKIVRGYKGSKDIILATERGEVHGLCGYAWTSLKTQNPTWVTEKKVNVLLQFAVDPDPELKAMGVPMIWDFVKSDDDRKLVDLLVAQQVFGRPYVAPPGIPEARVKALRAAFAATMQDKGYLADAEKLGLEVAWGSGEEVQKLVDNVFATPPAVVARLVKLMTP